MGYSLILCDRILKYLFPVLLPFLECFKYALLSHLFLPLSCTDKQLFFHLPFLPRFYDPLLRLTKLVYEERLLKSVTESINQIC